MGRNRREYGDDIEVTGRMWQAGLDVEMTFDDRCGEDRDMILRLKSIYRAMERVRREELDPAVKEANRKFWGG